MLFTGRHRAVSDRPQKSDITCHFSSGFGEFGDSWSCKAFMADSHFFSVLRTQVLQSSCREYSNFIFHPALPHLPLWMPQKGKAAQRRWGSSPELLGCTSQGKRKHSSQWLCKSLWLISRCYCYPKQFPVWEVLKIMQSSPYSYFNSSTNTVQEWMKSWIMQD